MAQDAGGGAGYPATSPGPAAGPEGPAVASEKPISVGLLLGYGVSLESGDGSPWGLGLGVRGGYNIGQIYLGARFGYNLGSEFVSSWELGVEGGYDVAAAEGLVIRPELSLGLVNMTVTIPAIPGFTAEMTASESDFYLAPGVAVIYSVNDTFFIGADVRLQLIMADSMVKALTLFVNGGMRF